MTQPCAVLRECTAYSKACCQLLAGGGGAAALLRVLGSCNRSAPHVAFLHSALPVLGALARQPATAAALLETDGCVAMLSELLQLFREKQARLRPRSPPSMGSLTCMPLQTLSVRSDAFQLHSLRLSSQSSR